MRAGLRVYSVGQELTLVHRLSFSRVRVKVVRVEPDLVILWPGCGESRVVDGRLVDAPMWEVAE